MYHPINKPDCAPQLENLMALARTTIAFGLENDATIVAGYEGEIDEQAALARRLGANFLLEHGSFRFLAAVHSRFIEYFEVQGSRLAGEWLWNKPAAIAEWVVRLLVIPLSEKQGILEAFDADIDLEARFADGHFHYLVIPATCATALSLVRQILLNFYSDILAGSGVPPNVLGEAQVLDRQVVLQAYLRANRHLKVCPGCDGSPPSLANGIVHADFDHFFPKSKYPFLAIHPINLTPYCKDCNQTYKQSKDALEASGVSSLADIYHPYLRPAYQEVRVVVERNPSDGQPRLHLRTDANSHQHAVRLNSLNQLLNLEPRWEGDRSQGRLSTKLEYALTHATQDERKAGHSPTIAWFEEKLNVVAATMKAFLGKDEGLVPALAYAQWVANDDEAKAEWFERYRVWHL